MELAPTTSLLSEQVAQLKEKSLATLTVAASCCPSTRYLRTKPVCGPHVGPPPPDVGPRGGGGRGCPGLGDGVAPGMPPNDAKTQRRCLRLHKLDSLLPGVQCLPFIHIATEEGSEGMQPEALCCWGFCGFVWIFLHLEERAMFDSALCMFLLGNKCWLRACLFSCGCAYFFNKWEEKIYQYSPLSLLSAPPPVLPRP